MIRRRLTLLALLCAPLMAWSQAYPNKPIRLVVPYAPGGAVDSLARPVAQKLSEILGQPVIVDNRPGANATLGADNVARSSPDGYSIVLTSIVHYLVPFFSKNVPYDTMKDFTPIAQMAITPNILAVHPSMPVNSIKELIDYAKKNPGKLFYGTTGVGSTHHLGGVTNPRGHPHLADHLAPCQSRALAGPGGDRRQARTLFTRCALDWRDRAWLCRARHLVWRAGASQHAQAHRGQAQRRIPPSHQHARDQATLGSRWL